MQKVKKIGVLSLGKIFGVLYALMGLIFGTIVALISLVGLAFSQSEAGKFSILFGVGAVIILPVFYGVMGFIGGVITAWFYNLAAKWTGGLEVEIE